MFFRSLVTFIFITLSLGTSDFAVAKQEVELLNSFLTSGGRQVLDDSFKRTDETIFLHEDKVYHFANFIWENIEKPAGKHKFDTKWYSSDRLVSVQKNKMLFKSSPWNTWSWIYASTLGYGDHKVELYVDGKLMVTRKFQVVTDEAFAKLNSQRLGSLIEFMNSSQTNPVAE